MLRKWFQKWLTKSVDSNLDPTSVITVLEKNGNKKVLLGGKELTKREIELLKGEVTAWRQGQLWRIMQETVKHKAIETGFFQSTNFEQTAFGKAMVHNLGIQSSILDIVDNLRLPEA